VFDPVSFRSFGSKVLLANSINAPTITQPCANPSGSLWMVFAGREVILLMSFLRKRESSKHPRIAFSR